MLMGLLVVLAIVWTYYNITLGLALEDEFAKLRERGEPIAMDQIIPKMPRRHENAAYVYEQAFRVFQEWQPIPEGAVSGTKLGDLGADHTLDEFIHGERQELAPDTRGWLFSDEIDRRLEAVKRASQMDECVFPVNWEDGFGALLPHLAQFRAAQRLVTARMMIAAREGRTEEALDWCEVGLRMTGHVSQEPTLIAVLVQIAMHSILSSGFEDVCGQMAVPSERARHLRDVLTDEDLWDAFSRAMLAERVFGGWIFDNIRSEAVLEMLENDVPPPLDGLWGFYGGTLAGPLLKHDRLTHLRVMDAQLAYLDQPWREATPGLSPVEEMVREIRWTAPLTRMIVPALGRAQMKRDLGIARLSQFQIALMLNVYRQEHGGYPPTLDALAEAIDWPIPDDIFSGEPFHYQREGGGYRLWSLGQDLDDDGGVGPSETEGRGWDDSDIVWRVEG